MRRLARPAAAPRGLRRPAAAVGAAAPPVERRVRRRPARGEEAEAEEAREGGDPSGEEAVRKYQAGDKVEAVKVPPGRFGKGDWVVAKEGCYNQHKAAFAFRIEKEEIEGADRELIGFLTGTEDPCRVRVHLCPTGCAQLRENPNLLHTTHLVKLGDAAPRTWEENLKEESETALLRAEAADWSKREEAEKQKEGVRSPSSSASRRKKKKKKKKKEEKERRASRPPEKIKVGGKTVAKKSLEALFQGTGLDPNKKNRKRLAKKVKKALKKGIDSSSSSRSSSSTSSTSMGEDELLQDRSRVHRLATLAPGLLTMQGVSNMKTYLTQISGSGWEAEGQNQVPPLLSLYNRVYMAQKLSGGVAREFATLSFVGDLVLQGRVAEAMDCVLQRLKSLEMTSSGTPWSTSQKIELVPPTNAEISSRQEKQVARKEARLDQEASGAPQSSDKGKGRGKEKGKEKGKERNKGKGKDPGEGKKSS